jgi:hypothetical protein
LALRRKGASTIPEAPPERAQHRWHPQGYRFLDFPAEMFRQRPIASATDGRPCWFGAHRSIQNSRRAMLFPIAN